MPAWWSTGATRRLTWATSFRETGVWADEYYTIYPDGVGVRCVDGIDDGWHDTQFLSEPGTTCLDNMDLTALTVANMSGEART